MIKPIIRPIKEIDVFLTSICAKDKPLLLALSGGPDSLFLFYYLVQYRKRTQIFFHVAHVDHGWRQESLSERLTLERLAADHDVPFHLLNLNPIELTGNLEAACRKERYAFFYQLTLKYQFQATLTGHHLNDQCETVFKRICEGAHWSKWDALQKDTFVEGVRVLRPLLPLSKKQICGYLEELNLKFFEDETNRDCHFFRAKLREKIFPWLNEAFGKNIEPGFAVIASDAHELNDYFSEKLNPLLSLAVKEPNGVRYPFNDQLPNSLLEIKYLLRLVFKAHECTFSRQIIDLAAKALFEGKANLEFATKSHKIYIVRKSLLFMT